MLGEQELNRANIAFRKNDNAFLAVDNVEALQAAADKLSPAIIRERLDYWTFILGPKFSSTAACTLVRFSKIEGIGTIYAKAPAEAGAISRGQVRPR